MEINCNLGRYNKSSSDYAYRSERRTPGQKEGETRTRKKTSGPPAQSEAIDTMAVRSNLYQPQRTANADEKREQGNERLQGLPHTTGHARQDEPARVLGRAAAAGILASTAGTLFATSAAAQEPKRGGHLKLGLEGAAATDSKDPAKALSQFMFVVGRNWGDMLVESHPTTGAPVPALAESWEPRPTRRPGPLPSARA